MADDTAYHYNYICSKEDFISYTKKLLHMADSFFNQTDDAKKNWEQMLKDVEDNGINPMEIIINIDGKEYELGILVLDAIENAGGSSFEYREYWEWDVWRKENQDEELLNLIRGMVDAKER